MRGCAPVVVFGACASALLVGGGLSPPAYSAQRPSVDASFEIVAGVRFGPIRETTTRAALSSLFPRAVIQDEEIYVDGCICVDGTRVFAGSADEIEMGWQDASRSRVAFAKTANPNGRWATTRGVRVGVLLSELERLSGEVLSFSGFGWDYGGTLPWSESTGGIILQLEIDPADAKRADAAPNAEIFGDREVPSDDPLIRTLRVRVAEIFMRWGNAFAEKDCTSRRRAEPLSAKNERTPHAATLIGTLWARPRGDVGGPQRNAEAVNRQIL